MTIEEVRDALSAFCVRSDCLTCPCVYDPEQNCYSYASVEHLIANYTRAFGVAPEVDNIKNDVVNHPSHYTQGGIECIDAMKAAFGADELAVYCKIAAFKYIWRCNLKNGTEDVKKAVWYLTNT